VKHYIAKWKTYEFRYKPAWPSGYRHRGTDERSSIIYASSLRQVRDMIEQMDSNAHMIKVSIYKETE
jgi:hypothetical protein